MFSSSESLVVALAQLMDHRELALLGGGGTYVAFDCYSPSDPQSHVWDLQKVTPCLGHRGVDQIQHEYYHGCGRGYIGYEDDRARMIETVGARPWSLEFSSI